MFDLPPDYFLVQDEAADRYYVRCWDKYIVTKHTGSKKWFNIKSTIQKRRGERWISAAENWIWRYSDGMIDGYEKEH
jgi:hypothetical protein